MFKIILAESNPELAESLAKTNIIVQGRYLEGIEQKEFNNQDEASAYIMSLENKHTFDRKVTYLITKIV